MKKLNYENILSRANIYYAQSIGDRYDHLGHLLPPAQIYDRQIQAAMKAIIDELNLLINELNKSNE